jgi:hypothetical protein
MGVEYEGDRAGKSRHKSLHIMCLATLNVCQSDLIRPKTCLHWGVDGRGRGEREHERGGPS